MDLVGVDEGEVERTDSFGTELRKLVQGRADPDLDDLAQTGGGDARRRHRGVLGIGLEGNQATARRQCPGQPDSAVVGQGAERPRPERLCTAEVYQEAAMGRKPGSPAERAEMETASRGARRRERWLQRAERVSDAFGLVLVLVLITYVLASLLENRGWTAVLLTVATSATSVVALTSSHAKARLVRIALALSALTIALAAVGAASGNHDWLNLATLLQVSLLTLVMGAVGQTTQQNGLDPAGLSNMLNAQREEAQSNAPDVMGMLGSILDQNKDGSAMDDLQRMAASFFK